MTNDIAALRSRKISALAALFGLSLITGIIGAVWFPDTSLSQASPDRAASADATLFYMLSNLALFAPAFAWLNLDGQEHGYRRSMNLNIGIVLLAAVFVPVYFYRSRPEGSRLRPALASIGAMIACMVSGGIGAALADFFVTPT